MSAGLAGPLKPVRYADGTTEYHDLPRNTLDIRYTACGNHHLACDCREALLAEDINEYRMMLRQVEQAIIAATADHQVWAYDGPGWEDEFGACKCQLCAIRRECHIGYSEFVKARFAASERLAAAVREHNEAASVTPGHPDYVDVPIPIDEVPF